LGQHSEWKILADISSVKDASVESRGATREARRHIPYNPDRTQKEILRDQIEQIEAIDEGLSKSGYSKDPANSLVSRPSCQTPGISSPKAPDPQSAPQK